MERSGGYGQSLAHSFSLPSLVEGSEPISEAEEFVEMKSLRERGDKALKINDFKEAIKYYNEALEIDDKNSDVLLARATACIQMGDYISAQRDTEALIGQETDNSKAFKLQGLALKHLNQNKEALASFLTALDLDPDNADELTDYIADVAAAVCHLPKDMMDSLKDMDSYKKLSEVGVYLFQAKKYKVCIKILEAAQKFQTNQKGITMRILLTLANAHSALKHTEKAINLYQECLSTAIATHDQVYQTKALVNIATLYLENQDTHQAIIYYEKLLHLETELLAETGSDEELPDFWTKELQCGLHLNLSIAYKAIGDMRSAIKHAKKYVEFIERYNFQGKLKAESYHNTGMLNEILSNYNDAINNYNKYLQECKKNGDKKGMAQAYGCLGSVYAALRNWKLSTTYHEQYVVMAKRFDDKRMQAIANEMLADTLMLKDDFEGAVTVYEEMLKCCLRTDYRTRAMGMCKLGNAYRAQKKIRHSLAFYEQASDLAQDFEYPEIEMMSHYNIACIHQSSSQMMELEQALKYFLSLIPFLETKIREHMEEDSHCPEEYYTQLSECYDGIQTVLTKLGNKEECLQYAEAFRKRPLTQTHNYQASAMTSQSHTAPWDIWTVERMNRVVSQQNSTVLYYSLLKTHLLLWVLKPGEGLVRFYSKKAAEGDNMIETVESTVAEIWDTCDQRKLQNDCESRGLPLKTSDLEMVRRKYMSLNKSVKNVDKKSDKENSDIKHEKSAERRLYDLLFSPVEDILTKLGRNAPLIVVPDKVLHHCPFGLVQDFLNRYAFQRFHLTYLPSLLLLDKVIGNELNRLRAQDDLEFERAQNKKGGIFKLMKKTSISGDFGSISVMSGESGGVVNPKRVSHPRLLRTQSPKLKMISPKPGKIPHERTMYEEDFKQHQPWRSPRFDRSLHIIPESVRGTPSFHSRHHGAPTPLEKMMSFHTYSTLTTETSTGTDITSANTLITQFRQISCKDRCLVFGNPKLPDRLMLHGKYWCPGLEEMVAAKRESYNVATCLDVAPVTGLDATKERFMKDITQASIVHIVTYGCWQEGLLVFTPSQANIQEEVPGEETYIVTVDDILGLKINAQLVVINTGFTPYRKLLMGPGYLLPSAFLAAGAQCVMVTAWQVPDLAAEKFYHTFYMALQNGALVSDAAKTAQETLKKDDRFGHPFFWSPYLLIGKDVKISLTDIRHSMLDQCLDQTETDVEEEQGKDYLNPKPVLAPVSKKEDNLRLLQTALGVLLQKHSQQPLVVTELIDLLDSALKRLHTDDNNKQTSNLSEHITSATGAFDLLKVLGFHFQAKGATLKDPYVVYPHWNKDELLIPTYDALRAMLELSDTPQLVQALCSVLPMAQDNISLIIDLLSVTKHAPEVQLKVSDLSIRPLWVNMKLKQLLSSLGFHQIGMLLNFNRTPENRQLLMALFQFMLSVSQHKSQVLLYRLDVNLLGSQTDSKSSSMLPELSRLPSLTPLILPRNQLRMSTPWLSTTEKPREMEEKLKLAKSRSNLDDTFKGYLERAKTWHQMTVVAQANESLAKYGRPQTSPEKVKVMAGATASTERIPVYQEPSLDNMETDQRRDYAHYVLQHRIQNIDRRHKNEVLKLYLPSLSVLPFHQLEMMKTLLRRTDTPLKGRVPELLPQLKK